MGHNLVGIVSFGFCGFYLVVLAHLVDYWWWGWTGLEWMGDLVWGCSRTKCARRAL